MLDGYSGAVLGCPFMSGQPVYGAKRAPGKTREMVLKFARMGLKQAEIARVVGISREAVRNHMKKLRESGELELEERSA